MNLFITRLLSAICLYLCLAVANQQNVLANFILVFGYRSLLIFSPLLESVLKGNSLKITLGLVSVGLLLNFLDASILATILIALGLSISGFLIKKLAAETPSLAGFNKIALSSGNIMAGGILYAVHNNSYNAWAIATFLMVVACFIAPRISASAKKESSFIVPLNIKGNACFYVAWLCIGSAIGIRIFGLYTVLPLYLIKEFGFLPEWYGPLLTFYGVLVIITQLPAVLKKFHPSLKLSLAVLGASCIVIGIPDLCNVHFVGGAIFWVFLLSLEEIFAPYIDFYSAKDGKLFIKEISISLGGGLCVLIMRLTNTPIFVSALACVLLFIGYIFLNNDREKSLLTKARLS